jgi:hypothetical protein
MRRSKMKILVRTAIVVGIAGALALGSMTASQARVRPWIAGAAGFVAGAAIGAAAANAGGYYYDNGYYDGGYGYYDSYASAPDYGYTYDAPARAYTGDPAYAGYRGYGYYGYNGTPYWQERRLEGRDY